MTPLDQSVHVHFFLQATSRSKHLYNMLNGLIVSKQSLSWEYGRLSLSRPHSSWVGSSTSMDQQEYTGSKSGSALEELSIETSSTLKELHFLTPLMQTFKKMGMVTLKD